jgi:lipoprotein-releasing system permease protein
VSLDGSAPARGMGAGYELFIALRYLRAKRKQTFVSLITLISILGVAVGTAALIIALALMTGFEQDIRERIFAGNGHIIISRLLGGSEIVDTEAIIRKIEAVPGVAGASAVAEGYGLLFGASGREAEKGLFLGVEPGREARVTNIAASMVSGSFDDLGQWTGGGSPAPVILGVEIARGIGAKTGDTVQVALVSARLTPWGAMPRTIWLRVAGVFDAGFYEYNATRCYLPMALALKLFHREGASWIAVRVADLADLDRAEEGIRAALGKEYFVDDMLRQNRSLLRALRLEKLLMFIAISLIVMVACLNIVSTLILLVMEKVRDIGVLVAMGATSRGIMLLFLIQGLVIGLLGTATGVTLGTVATMVMEHYKWPPLDPDIYYVSHVPFRAHPMDVAGVALLAMAISLVATLYPAWKASRLDPVQALRYE